MAKIDSFLKKAFKIKASDLHIASGNPPMYRRYGRLKKFKYEELTPKANKELIYEILSPEQRERFEKNYELDFCYEIKDVARFAGTYFIKGQEWMPVSESSLSIFHPSTSLDFLQW